VSALTAMIICGSDVWRSERHTPSGILRRYESAFLANVELFPWAFRCLWSCPAGELTLWRATIDIIELEGRTAKDYTRPGLWIWSPDESTTSASKIGVGEPPIAYRDFCFIFYFCCSESMIASCRISNASTSAVNSWTIVLPMRHSPDTPWIYNNS